MFKVSLFSYLTIGPELLELHRPRTEAGLVGVVVKSMHSLLLSVALVPFPRMWSSDVDFYHIRKINQS